MYQKGEGVNQDHTEAVRWYRKAAVQGYADAQFNLGLILTNGRGVKLDHTEAVRWYRKAAEQGSTIAQFKIGGMYYQGHGVKKNIDEALRWFQKAAEKGHAEAKEVVLLFEKELRTSSNAAFPASPSRTCANCGVAETEGSSVALKPCPRCKAVVYCGKGCQAHHWKAGGHRGGCK